jgi:hypothetical protein
MHPAICHAAILRASSTSWCLCVLAAVLDQSACTTSLLPISRLCNMTSCHVSIFRVTLVEELLQRRLNVLLCKVTMYGRTLVKQDSYSAIVLLALADGTCGFITCPLAHAACVQQGAAKGCDTALFWTDRSHCDNALLQWSRQRPAAAATGSCLDLWSSQG